MSSRGYLKHNMIVVAESKYPWGGTDYTQFALKSDTTIPTGLSTSTYLEERRNGQPSITDATFTETFIIPTVFDAISIIDGTIEGTIKLEAHIEGTYTASSFVSITKAELTIRAIDSTGTARTISSKRDIWTGEIKADTGSTTTSAQLIYWTDVEDVIVYSNERVVLDYTITYSTYDSLSQDDLRARLYCTPETDEMAVTLPFVM